MNVAPSPSPSLKAVTLPPCSSARWRTIASPIPSPPVLARVCRVLLTETIEHVRQERRRDSNPGVGDVERDGVAVASGGHADLSAFGCELDRIGQQVPGDLLHAPRVAQEGQFLRLDVRDHGDAPCFRGVAHGLECAVDHTLTVTRFESSRSLPVMIRETSSRSSMSCSWICEFRSMMSIARRVVGSSRCPAASSRAQPRMAFSGVRSSCDRVARNSSFARFAAWASSRASCSRSSSCCRSLSARWIAMA